MEPLLALFVPLGCLFSPVCRVCTGGGVEGQVAGSRRVTIGDLGQRACCLALVALQVGAGSHTHRKFHRDLPLRVISSAPSPVAALLPDTVRWSAPLSGFRLVLSTVY